MKLFCTNNLSTTDECRHYLADDDDGDGGARYAGDEVLVTVVMVL